MNGECLYPDSKFELGKKLHKEIVDVIHGSFRNTKEITDLSVRCLSFFLRNEAHKVVTAAYGYPLTEKILFLYYIATQEKERKKGYGTSLINGLLSGGKMAFDQVVVNVGKTDEWMLTFYFRMGFLPYTDKQSKDHGIYDDEKVAMASEGNRIITWKPQVGDRIEWLNPLTVNRVKVTIDSDKTEQVHFHRVHFGWKKVDKKWRLLEPLKPKIMEWCREHPGEPFMVSNCVATLSDIDCVHIKKEKIVDHNAGAIIDSTKERRNDKGEDVKPATGCEHIKKETNVDHNAGAVKDSEEPRRNGQREDVKPAAGCKHNTTDKKRASDGEIEVSDKDDEDQGLFEINAEKSFQSEDDSSDDEMFDPDYLLRSESKFLASLKRLKRSMSKMDEDLTRILD